MADFLTSLFGKKEKSKDVAKDRLKLVLVHDRVNTSSHVLELLKSDIIKVISTYMEIDEQELDIQITNAPGEDGENASPMLLANIPIKNMRK